MTSKNATTLTVNMTREPGERGYVKELIEKTWDWSISDTIAFAKSQGKTLKRGHVYNIRTLVKHKGKPTKPARLVSSKPLLTEDGSRLIPGYSTELYIKPTANPEQAMINIVVELGALVAMQLLYKTLSKTRRLG